MPSPTQQPQPTSPRGDDPSEPAPGRVRRRRALSRILSRLRGETAAGGEGGELPGGADPARPAPCPPREDAGAAPARLFHLEVDDVGGFLVAVGSPLRLGHSRGGRADLPFLADVAPVHARLAFRGESFHGGLSWTLEPEPGQAVEVGGRRLGSGPRELAAGERVRLAGNLGFRFRLPDPAGGAAVLELFEGAECCGAHRILLHGADSGRIRIGPRGAIRVPGLASGVELELSPAALVARCEAGFLALGDRAPGGPQVELPFPPAERVDLFVERAGGGRAPFGISIRPVEGP